MYKDVVIVASMNDLHVGQPQYTLYKVTIHCTCISKVNIIIQQTHLNAFGLRPAMWGIPFTSLS